MRGDGTFFVVWTSDGQDGDGVGVFGRAFDRSGAPVGQEMQMNDHTALHQSAPAVALGDACVSPDVVLPPTSSFGANPVIGRGTVIEDDVGFGGDTVRIGAGAMILMGARIGRGATVPAGAIVPAGTSLPPGAVVR